jgi:hypothetical protein
VILPSIGLIGTGSPALDHCSQENVLSVSRTIEMIAREDFGRGRVPVRVDRSSHAEKMIRRLGVVIDGSRFCQVENTQSLLNIFSRLSVPS